MMNSSLFKTVANAALARFDTVMSEVGLEGGKDSGREYLPLNPTRNDHTAGSLSINRDKGAWMEGATGDKAAIWLAWLLTCGIAASRMPLSD